MGRGHGEAADPGPLQQARCPPLPMQVFREGLAYLHGSDGLQDHGMAAARLLYASDLGCPIAHFHSALLYSCGVGVARSTQSAAEYARRYLAVETQGPFARLAKHLEDGSLDAEHARRLLLESVRSGEVSAPAAAGTSRLLVIAAVGVVVLLAGAAAFFVSRLGA